MEGFLEANRIVELSLSKLSTIKRSGNLPLRRTLLISQVLNVAEDVATSAQDSLLYPHTSSNRCSSKLLANFGHNQSNIESDGLPASHIRTLKPLTRQQSPIAVPSPVSALSIFTIDTTCASTNHPIEVEQDLSDEEPMDFDNVNSLLGDILQDVDSDELPTANLCQHQISEVERAFSVNYWHECVIDESLESEAISRPVSPGKRNYKEAFPFVVPTENTKTCQEPFNNLKRFKSCTTLEASPLESLPGSCGYLSSKNLQTAPFITYMFGRGFTYPSNPNLASCDWPTGLGILDQELATLSSVAPILAF